MPHGTRSKSRARAQNNLERNQVEAAQNVEGAHVGAAEAEGGPTEGTPSITVTMSPAHVARLRQQGAEKEKDKGLNMFHDHFAGFKTYPLHMLRIFVVDEIKRVEKWDKVVEGQMHKDLTRAVPEMSVVMGGHKWPEPVGFTASQVKDAYLIFLRFFLEQYFQDVGADADSDLGGDEGEGAEAECVPPKRRRAKEKEESGEDEKDPGAKRKRRKGRRGQKGAKKKRKASPAKSSSSDSSTADDSSTDPSSDSESDGESSDSSSEGSSSSESSSSEEERRRRRRRKRKQKRRARKKKAKARKSKKSRRKRSKRSKKSARKVSFSDRVKAIHTSQKVGAKKYSEEHLYRCQEVVKAYKTWANPRSRADKKATVPKTVRSFADRYLADPDAKIMDVYELPHVKKNAEERKHVTFLMNKVGKLTSKIATARLERARMALDKHNRLIEGAKLSRKAREESIKSECAWAGKIRWYSEIIGEGEAKFYAAKAKLEEQKKLDNFRCAHPDVTESEAKRIVRKLADGARAEAGVTSSPMGGAKSAQMKEINALKSKLGQLMRKAKATEPANPGTPQPPNREKKFKFECWHCKSKKHPVALCPVRAAGKPAVKGSYFWKQKQNEKPKE